MASWARWLSEYLKFKRKERKKRISRVGSGLRRVVCGENVSKSVQNVPHQNKNTQTAVVGLMLRDLLMGPRRVAYNLEIIFSEEWTLIASKHHEKWPKNLSKNSIQFFLEIPWRSGWLVVTILPFWLIDRDVRNAWFTKSLHQHFADKGSRIACDETFRS